MDFKLKDKVGSGVLLLLMILISQSRILDMLFDTVLGRVLLIGLIIAISYMNKTMGVVGVFLIIIAISNARMFEGFETKHADKHEDKHADKHEDKEKVKDKDTEKIKVAAGKKDEPTKAIEGFDILGKERSIQQGKNSNTIPVNKSGGETSSSFMPFEDWTLMKSFTAF
jgi:hypothetical protein